ncbi:cytidyltransferase-related enzyme [Methanomethylovorans hollandica DSM 15978]|jgi:pantetheine-phosphate adenylyltransferase|uniref:Phosphopantetheine adenylyltransferase n=1 Tax=Methanomethylovorans hollandica (strain DSM 15978 / NBRC 107637 / DMS1) TaxID=867904 RepID=L0L0H5_METHD|nr:phosphopantetheine adenylyltransferase [Methanomethylovorans hollandica]AGB50445.1 cytidyltransferase-related enzyme [Methanomethylovorans hollandica DSM 15978]
MPRVVVGGTFECLHDGHRELLKKAFELAGNEEVHIGLTSNEMANMRPRKIPDYSIRKEKIIRYIHQITVCQKYTIIELNDPYGKTLEEDYDYIVVSPETYPVALKINKLRAEKNLKDINIVKIDYVLADDQIRISSTRIVLGEIDIHGRLKS